MFNLNFISESGLQKKISDASWSYLHKRNESDSDDQAYTQNVKKSFTIKNSLKYYIIAFSILSFFVFVEIMNIYYSNVKPDMILNQVIDIIVESGYIKDLQLYEANFSSDKVQVLIRSRDYESVQKLTQGYHLENEIPYEMFQKGNYSYLSLLLPWEGKKRGGDLKTLQSLATKTVFSNKITITSTENEFQIFGRSSDIISYLLQMADTDQIQKFSFSVYHLETGEFNLKIKLDQS